MPVVPVVVAPVTADDPAMVAAMMAMAMNRGGVDLGARRRQRRRSRKRRRSGQRGRSGLRSGGPGELDTWNGG
ncbi:MAG TPA: hypothetical protein VLX28_07205 [Thermoanaerobaculia bacterium]|nr:hypothetical protein [Thermoanaerobaculia bacterium]